MTSNIKGGKKWLGIAAGLLMVTVMPSYAVDGVIEINQARALAGGVTAGDSPGFPVTIDQPGSYRLTGNLTVPDADTTGIEITSEDVTVDLNGFAIIGPNRCGGSPLNCNSSGAGRGITVTGSPFGKRNITVVNGTVRGMGGEGVFLDTGGRVENVHVFSNGSNGIEVRFLGAVTGSVAYANGGHGISALHGRALVSGNTVGSNGGAGIYAFESSIVTGNVVTSSGGDGILTMAGCTVTGNTVRSSGGDGISVGVGSTVIGNTSMQNDRYGLKLGGTTGYSNNVVGFNVMGTVSGGVQMGTNVCNGSTTCP